MTRADPFAWLGCTLEDRVVLEEVVGEGGFGVVYRGRHLRFDETVAVKCLKVPPDLDDATRASFVEDFRTEARLLHRLSRKSKGIVQALDVGAAVSTNGIWVPFIVMEWAAGVTLEHDLAQRSRERRAPRSLAESASLLTPVAEALAVAHAEGVAHLDVKPGNIVIAPDGSTKLLDFGIAKLLSKSHTLTRAGTGGGLMPAPFTPGYGAPEQFNARHGRRGPPTDVFALTLVLLETCSGQAALTGDSPIQLYVAAASDTLRPSLGSQGVNATAAVEEVVRRALEVDPTKRHPDAGQMWSALQNALRDSPLAATVSSRGSVSIVPAPAPSASVSFLPSSSSFVAPSSVAVTAPAAPTLGSAQNRICTVLFAELAGPEDVERLDPEELVEAMSRGVNEITAAVQALGGTIEGVVGETVMAVFGMYGDSASAAERAVHAAMRIRAALPGVPVSPRRAPAPRIGVRLGLSTGRVFVGAQASTSGFKLTASGGPVKLAPRLQRLATPGTVIIDRDTHRQVAGLFDVEPVARAGDSARPAELKAFSVLGAASGRHGLNATVLREFYGLSTRFVGRSAEMATLAATLETVVQEPCARFVTLLGTPGLGKSRLLVELADRLEADDWVVVAAHCSALRVRTSYGLAAELLRSRFHVHEDDAPDVAAAKLTAGMRRLRGVSTLEGRDVPTTASRALHGDDEAEAEIATQLLRLLGVKGHQSEPPVSVEEQESPAKRRIAGAVAALLGMATRPIAIVCDDLQWADEASLSLLQDLCVRLPTTPLLIVCAATFDLVERSPLWGEGDAAHARIVLGPLARRHLEEMTRDRLRRIEALADEAVARLVEHSDGSPLTLVETLHLLVDVSAIDITDRERWRLKDERLRELALPTSVHGIVQARLDRLDPTARLTLSRAAVVGRTFWEGVLSDLDTARPAGGAVDLGRVLADLRDRGLVRARASSTFPDEHEYVFAEGATQQVAYEMLGRKERRDLHAVVAGWLSARNPSDAGAALVAAHYEKAAALEQALEAYRRAGAHAAGLGQNAESMECYERACRIDDWMTGQTVADDETSTGFVEWEAPEDARTASWQSRVALRTEAADVLRRMGRFEAAEARYLEARARIVGVERRQGEPGDPDDAPRWAARVDYRLAVLEKLRGKVDEALALLEGAIAAAERGGLQEERAEMLALRAELFSRLQGRADACRQACLSGLRVCRAIERRGERWRQAVSKLLNMLGTMFFRTGSFVRAERCYLQASRAIDERRNPHEASVVLNNVAAIAYARGDLERAGDCFQRVLRLTDRSGDLWVRLTALANLGEVELARGGHAGARDRLTEAVRLGEQIRAHLDLPECYQNLARALLLLGERGDALDAATRGLDLLTSTGSKLYLPSVLVTLAEVCAAVRDDAERDEGRYARAGALTARLLELLDTATMSDDVIARCRALVHSGAAGKNPPSA